MNYYTWKVCVGPAAGWRQNLVEAGTWVAHQELLEILGPEKNSLITNFYQNIYSQQLRDIEKTGI